MSVHQCPKCELRFERKTELDDHCWHDHPEFRHEYPATAHVAPAEPPHGHPVPRRPIHLRIGDMVNWLVPGRR
jgi:hypothetical protein